MEPVIKLQPVCVSWGDAIFITVEDGEHRDAYLVDGSTGTSGNGKNKEILKAAYDKIIIHEEFQLKQIIVTHPDVDHYGGIADILGFEARINNNYPPVLYTNRFDEAILRKIFTQNNYNQTYSLGLTKLQRSTFTEQNFSIEYKSFTSTLKLRCTRQQKIKNNQTNGRFIKVDESARDNESSIITTIYDRRNDILACLTGDAFFDNQNSWEFLHNKNITVFLVPHHGSKKNFKQRLSRTIAERTKYYLISCGSHRQYSFPHKDVLTAIRNATVNRQNREAIIVLTNGKHLTGSKVSSFRNTEYEPTIYYWDQHLYNEGYLTDAFLQFNLHPNPTLLTNNRLIEWSIEGYKSVVPDFVKRRELIHLRCRYDGNYLVIINRNINFTNNPENRFISGFGGHIPPPTSPCEWDMSSPLIMVDGTDDVVFLQESRQLSITPGILDHHTFFLFRCYRKPWQIQYACIRNGQLNWLTDCSNRLLQLNENPRACCLTVEQLFEDQDEEEEEEEENDDQSEDDEEEEEDNDDDNDVEDANDLDDDDDEDEQYINAGYNNAPLFYLAIYVLYLIFLM